MITAALLVFSPKEATKTANIRIHNLAPRKSTPDSIAAIVSASGAISSPKLNMARSLSLISCKIFILSSYFIYL